MSPKTSLRSPLQLPKLQKTQVCNQFRHISPSNSLLELSSKSKAPEPLDPSSAQAIKSPLGRGRQPRTPRRAVAQQVHLEALDDSLGPLGPLGDNAQAAQPDEPPVPPQKEQVVTHNIRQPMASSQPSIGRSMLDSADLNEDLEPTATGSRIPPPVQPSQGTPVKRDTQPSVSIEQAAKPTFEITVGDPHKVGDLTSSHIVYLVRTKVWRIFCDIALSILMDYRLLQKPIGNLSLRSLGDTAISYGSIIPCMRVTQGSSFLHRQRNKLLGGSTLISSSQEGQRLREC